VSRKGETRKWDRRKEIEIEIETFISHGTSLGFSTLIQYDTFILWI
jgi:hypothetical protein